MPSTKRIVLMLAVCAGLAAGAYAQKTPPPAAPAAGEELTSTAKPAGEPATQAAEKPADPNAPVAEPGRGRSFLETYMLPIMLGVLLLILFMNSRSRKKQESKHQRMLAALKKGDKVTSVGGIVGTIIEVRDDEILLKVDETNNVRMRFARWAIRGTGEKAKTEGPEDRK